MILTPARLHTKSSEGQALVELMIALVVAAMVILGFVVAVNVGLKSSAYADDKTLSVHYAMANLEEQRVLRDHLGFSSPGWVDVPPTGIPDTIFTEEVDITSLGTPVDTKIIKTIITWPTQQGEARTEMTTILTDWKQ